MNYYFRLLIIFYLITIGWLLIGNKGIKQNKKYFIVVFSILVLFLVLRKDTVGIDNDNYRSIFEYSHRLNPLDLISYERHEIGYKFYNKLVSSVYYNFNFFLMVTSVLSMIGIYFYIKDNSKNYVYSFLIFITFNFYGFFFGIFRQVLAISILFCSIKFIKEKKLCKFLLSVFLAFLFHKTALIFILAYPLSNVKINKKLFIIWTFCILSFMLFNNQILSFIIKYIYQPAETIGIGGSGYKMLVLLFLLSCVSYYFQDKLLKQDRNNQLFINMIFIATLLQCLSLVFGNVYRLVLYFSFAIILIIPNILELMKNKSIKITLITLMFISLTMYFYYMTTNLINYTPYEFLI